MHIVVLSYLSSLPKRALITLYSHCTIKKATQPTISSPYVNQCSYSYMIYCDKWNSSSGSEEAKSDVVSL
ncbi:hypothetical protein HZ326_10967 [Fusarium oxysporum f. sp. albedinis]|nr:hypothetical protein HZ326_10967 [Fusarium oxysporum f. sp. albedinis]